MLVFTLPSFRTCSSDPRPLRAAQDIDHQTVKDKYLLVKLTIGSAHGRYARYSLVALPLERFEPALVEELKREIGSQLEFDATSW